jgi:signal transduction histidine kinase
MSAVGGASTAPRWWRVAVAIVTVALIGGSVCVASIEAYLLHVSTATAVAAALDLLGAAALLGRRRWTTAVLVFEVAVAASTAVLSGPVIHSGTMFLAVVALYSYGTFRPPERTIVAAVVTGLAIAAADGISQGPLTELVPIAALFTAVTAVSLYVRSHRALLQSYRERAEQAEHEQQWTALRAVAAERVRIARELHDIVAHHVSLLVVQAGAVRETLPADHVTRPVLDSMIDGGRQAMAEMRDMLAALRFEDAGRSPPGEPAGSEPCAPQPTADQIPALVSGAQTAGLPVTLYVDGAAVEAPAGTSLAAYRIVQEALTNALKHAPGAFTTVRLIYEPDTLRVSVRNGPAPGPPSPGDRSGPGHGLVGMRERVDLAHGSMAVGPTRDGWEVRARLPLEPSARLTTPTVPARATPSTATARATPSTATARPTPPTATARPTAPTVPASS